MRGTKAKRLRRDRVAQGLEPFNKPKHNFTDLEDTNADRRLKSRHPKEYARQLKQTDPKTIRERLRKWNVAFLYLTAPKDLKPYLPRYVGDPTQEARQAHAEAEEAKP